MFEEEPLDVPRLEDRGRAKEHKGLAQTSPSAPRCWS